MTTLESLEQRVAALEREIAQLKSANGRDASAPPSEESRGARLLREADESRPAMIAAWEKFMKGLGIAGEPVDIKALRDEMIANGVNPADNSASRELIAMREE